MSDQEQQAQAAVGDQPQAVKESQWPRYDKHVHRIMRTGLEESQAAEIVEVQREIVTEVTEKFVTSEHFDSEVGKLKSGMDSLRGQVSDLGARVSGMEGKMQVLLWALGIGFSIFLAFQSALLVTMLRSMG